jgi:hypothetical protein
MKKLFIALALTAAGAAAPAFAGVGVSIQVGEPGFYGRLDVGDYDRPRLINNRPVIVTRGYRNAPPIYVRVPAAHQRNWSRYCSRYDACGRPVYFVRDEWYRDDYAPRYRRAHGHDRNWNDGRRDDDRHDRRDDDRHNRRDDDRNDHRDNDRSDRPNDRDEHDHERDWH